MSNQDKAVEINAVLNFFFLQGRGEPHVDHPDAVKDFAVRVSCLWRVWQSGSGK